MILQCCLNILQSWPLVTLLARMKNGSGEINLVNQIIHLCQISSLSLAVQQVATSWGIVPCPSCDITKKSYHVQPLLSDVLNKHLYAYVWRIIFPRCKFSQISWMDSQSWKFMLGCCMKFDYASLVELGMTVIFLYYWLAASNAGLYIKQQNTITTITAANYIMFKLQIATLVIGWYEWF